MLTDREIKAAGKREKLYRLADGGGLRLTVMPSGAKLWHYRYEFDGKERTLSIGTYPAVTAAHARKARDAARDLVREGKDPNVHKRIQRATRMQAAGVTFEVVARGWHEQMKGQWTARHGEDVLGSLEADVFPTLGTLPIADINTPMVLAVLKAIEKRQAIETAHRVRQRMSAVFVHAIATGQGTADPAAVVKQALKPVKRGRQPALADLAEARQLLLDVDAIPAHPTTKLALRLLALTVVRPGELAGARWVEFDLDGPDPTWTVPADRMKMKKEHAVPLAPEAVAVVRAVHNLTGRGPLLFPNARHAHKPISENAIGYMMNRAGYHGRHVPHGWRATFSTVMNTRHRPDKHVIDLMLAHAPENKVEAAYNRADHWQRKRELAEEWAALLLDGMPPALELLNGPRRPLKAPATGGDAPSGAGAPPRPPGRARVA